jgi:hypothetical protein
MTDAEKELRRLAQECDDKRSVGDWPAYMRSLHSKLWPKDVLALLDRIEALEKEHEEDQGVIRVWRRRANEAVRLGAEEMRTAAADHIRAASAVATFTLRTWDDRPLNPEEQRLHGEVESGLKRVLSTLADNIGALSIPGDAP